MKSFLWLLAMVAGLGLMVWMMPPHEVETRLKEEQRMRGNVDNQWKPSP